MKNKVPTLTRKDIAQHLVNRNSVKLVEAEYWVDETLDSMCELLMTADPEIRIELRDFGVFEVKLTQAKTGARNPKTGDRLYIPPRRKTRFKPSKLLRRFLNQALSQEEVLILDERKHPDDAEDLSPEPLDENNSAFIENVHSEQETVEDVLA